MKTVSPPTSRTKERGMTLIELLLVIVVLAVLAAFLVPGLRSMNESSKQASCASKLRNIGALFHLYAADRNGKVRFLRDGSGTPMWYDALRLQAGFSDQEAQQAFGCPKMPWKDVTAWRCYGMRLHYFTIPVAQDAGFPMERTAQAGHYGFRLSQVSEPGKFFIMADSATTSGTQSFRLADRWLYSGSGVCLRHLGKSNVLFLDGHVEGLSADGLKALNFTEVLDDEYRVKVL